MATHGADIENLNSASLRDAADGRDTVKRSTLVRKPSLSKVSARSWQRSTLSMVQAPEKSFWRTLKEAQLLSVAWWREAHSHARRRTLVNQATIEEAHASIIKQKGEFVTHGADIENLNSAVTANLASLRDAADVRK